MSSPAPDNLFSQLASAFREAEAWCFDHGATVSYSKPDGKPLVVVSVGECHGDGSSLIEGDRRMPGGDERRR